MPADLDESDGVTVAFRHFEGNEPLDTHINQLSQALAEFDWRSSDAPGADFRRASAPIRLSGQRWISRTARGVASPPLP